MADVVAAVDADIAQDIDAGAPTKQQVPRRWLVLAAISAGGVVGALARHGVTEAFPHAPGGFGWATFAVNVSGCLLIGVLMTLVEWIFTRQRLLRPFLGVGVLGGYTTFSTSMVEAQQAIGAGAARVGLLYLAATAVGALVAVWTGAIVTRRVLRHRTRTTTRPPSRARAALTGRSVVDEPGQRHSTP